MEYDDRPVELQKEFPLREIPLNMCICGHGNEDHITEPLKIGHLKLEDGACEKCVCQKFKQKRSES